MRRFTPLLIFPSFFSPSSCLSSFALSSSTAQRTSSSFPFCFYFSFCVFSPLVFVSPLSPPKSCEQTKGNVKRKGKGKPSGGWRRRQRPAPAAPFPSKPLRPPALEGLSWSLNVVINILSLTILATRWLLAAHEGRKEGRGEGKGGKQQEKGGERERLPLNNV